MIRKFPIHEMDQKLIAFLQFLFLDNFPNFLKNDTDILIDSFKLYEKLDIVLDNSESQVLQGFQFA